MQPTECVVHCDRRTGPIRPLSHAVMGNTSWNLLAEGVRLQRCLEEMCQTPLLLRTMGTLNTGIGIDNKTNWNEYPLR